MLSQAGTQREEPAERQSRPPEAPASPPSETSPLSIPPADITNSHDFAQWYGSVRNDLLEANCEKYQYGHISLTAVPGLVTATDFRNGDPTSKNSNIQPPTSIPCYATPPPPSISFPHCQNPFALSRHRPPPSSNNARACCLRKGRARSSRTTSTRICSITSF
jgi:hypothetical protein